MLGSEGVVVGVQGTCSVHVEFLGPKEPEEELGVLPAMGGVDGTFRFFVVLHQITEVVY